MKVSIWLKVAGWAVIVLVPITLSSLGFVWQLSTTTTRLSEQTASLAISIEKQGQRMDRILEYRLSAPRRGGERREWE